MIKQARRLLMLCMFMPALATAQEDWWFDIEVIIFDRNVALSQLEEQFEYADSLAPVDADVDLISSFLHPDISKLKQSLPTCDENLSPLWVPLPTLEEVLSEYATVDSESLPLTEREPSYTQTAPPPAFEDNLRQQTGMSSGAAMSAPVTAEEIARLWLEFLPETLEKPVSVSNIRSCQPAQPWLSYENGKWVRHSPDNALPYPDEIPVVLDGSEMAISNGAHILPRRYHELEKLSLQIRQARGLNRLLHATWRQQVVFGEKNANKVRIFAGKNYGNSFSLAGEQKTSDTGSDSVDIANVQNDSPRSDDIFVRLEQNLASARPVPFDTMIAAVRENNNKAQASPLDVHFASTIPIWQLEGYIKVFLKNINRVPYLHIDSEMFYRQPVPLESTTGQDDAQLRYQLKSVPFKQVRRVISKQLHYFDHPLFGMVVEIRRYQKPTGN